MLQLCIPVVLFLINVRNSTIVCLVKYTIVLHSYLSDILWEEESITLCKCVCWGGGAYSTHI